MAVRLRRRQRGFTLTELMAVVAIMGILALLATTLFVGHSRASKTGEAMAVMQAIRAAEERYRAENQVYFGNSTVWSPTDGKGDKRHSFLALGEDYAMWKTLSPTVNRPVQFGYRVNTGLPGEELPAVATSRKFASGTKPTEPWYVVQARADADSDNTYCAMVASSFSPEVISENEGE
jgi:type IV pilus assembly protein PilA